MARSGGEVFVDTGAWIALAIDTDPHHDRAVDAWEALRGAGARLATSVPVVLETFTFLDRNTTRAVALSWKNALGETSFLRLLECTTRDLATAWSFFERRDLYKLSAVDASSFVLMRRERIRHAFSFDTHFAAAGFRLVG